MAYDVSAPIRKAFGSLGQKNPLRSLKTEDRTFLWASLKVHSSSLEMSR